MTEETQLKTRWTVEELYNVEFPEPKWVVPEIIPNGLCFLGGRPKVGKSFFIMQTSIAVGCGGKMFDKDIPPGKVLYLSLEDSAKRLQKRLKDMQVPSTCNITFELKWTPFQGKGIDFLTQEIEKNEYSLVVIDTLTRATPGVDQNAAEVIGPIIARLQTLATASDISMMLIDHTRKPSGFFADPVDDIIASTAKTGAADAIFALYREQGKPGAVLKGRGRDMEEVDLRLRWEGTTFGWQCMGTSEELEITERRAEILSALEDHGKAQAGTISKAVKQDLSNTVKRLNELAAANMVSIEMIEGKKYYQKNIYR